VTHLLDHLTSVPPTVAYVVIGLLTFAEAGAFIGFVLPGETAVILGGALAATGHLSLPVLLVLVVTAALVGDTVGYEVGKHAGPRLLSSRLLRRHAERIDAARDVLRRRGGPAVLVGRFTAFLRAVTPALAGLSRMPYRTFLLYNAAGALVWGVGATLLGYFAGASYQRVAQTVGRGSAGLLLLLVLVAVVVWHRRRSRGAGHGRAETRGNRSEPEHRKLSG
jgi:membrane protein DedA with SNARE-associated domain